MASGFLRRALNLKEHGAKFSFKFKVADLKMEKITKFTSQLKRVKILYLITLIFQEATSLNSYREYIACVYNHKEPNSTFHRHFSFYRYTLLSFLCYLSIYTYRVDLYIYRHFLAHCSHIQAFLHLLLTQKVLLHSQNKGYLFLHYHHYSLQNKLTFL